MCRAKPSTNSPPKSGIKTTATPLPLIQRGELWLVDFGYLAMCIGKLSLEERAKIAAELCGWSDDDWDRQIS